MKFLGTLCAFAICLSAPLHADVDPSTMTHKMLTGYQGWFACSSDGSVMCKTAMFDEVDEATAIFRTAPTAALAPREIPTVTLDADGEALPSDWYLRLVGEASRVLRKETLLTEEIPIRP